MGPPPGRLAPSPRRPDSLHRSVSLSLARLAPSRLWPDSSPARLASEIAGPTPSKSGRRYHAGSYSESHVLRGPAVSGGGVGGCESESGARACPAASLDGLACARSDSASESAFFTFWSIRVIHHDRRCGPPRALRLCPCGPASVGSARAGGRVARRALARRRRAVARLTRAHERDQKHDGRPSRSSTTQTPPG